MESFFTTLIGIFDWYWAALFKDGSSLKAAISNRRRNAITDEAILIIFSQQPG